MFKNAKVSDKVWSLIDGWGEVIKIVDDDFPIKVKFENGSFETFTICGKIKYGIKSPTLFWDEVKFEIPKPKNTGIFEDDEDMYDEENDIISHIRYIDSFEE